MPDANKEVIKAAKMGDIEKVKTLLAADPNLIHARDNDGSTALHCATWKGHHAIVALLVRAGADVNAQNSNGHWGTTPLHAAAHANEAAIAQLLLEHGADVDARDMNGKTPLHHTTFHEAKAVARILKDCGGV
ncbi:MAG TPA: ankyrin repeat domain-containing protein [Blastocatellia bacterium]|nr:ankyrin repeat domain-containing protein [Blastocatellia bacterium]